MAKKNEFKPDKLRAGFLSKLYLTRKQRLNILKWLLYSLLLLLLSVLQDVSFCRMRFFGATTDLVPCGIFLICVLEGMHAGSVFTLCAACFYAFSGTAPGIYCIALITVLSIFVSYFRQSFLQKGFSATMLCMAIALLLYEMTVFAAGILMSLTTLQRVTIPLVTALLSLLASAVLYPAVKAIGTIGGETWKE